MAKKHSHNHGLGKAIINHRAKTKQLDHERGLHTTEIYDNKPISVTQENDLENFLNTATLAGTEFTAERQNVAILPSLDNSHTRRNPYLLSDCDHALLKLEHRRHQNLLRVPRRPSWSHSTTPAQLDHLEREAFLDWRRALADLSDNRALLLTPFERNLQVWRQLWRVLEKSQLIVQIVDARNPLRFRCEDLEKYVNELSDVELARSNHISSPHSKNLKTKSNLLLINKADLLTEKQRQIWADYLASNGIQYAFFSATAAVALQQRTDENSPRTQFLESEQDSEEELDQVTEHGSPEASKGWERELPSDDSLHTDHSATSPHSAPHGVLSTVQVDSSPRSDSAVAQLAPMQSLSLCEGRSAPDPKTKVLTVEELEELFLSHAKCLVPPPGDSPVRQSAPPNGPSKLVVGLVGYPNVGKSSTINALVGSKKVSVSSTPGKTKHFQTIHLSPEVILCDCPGLVFPQFAATKAELVCDGVLPVDQMREHTAPISLVTQRMPKAVLEATYGLQIPTLSVEEGGTSGMDDCVRASDLLVAYAIARGYFTGGGGMGRPDESKAARPILKDYVNAKLLYCEPPPPPSSSLEDAELLHQCVVMSGKEFNAESHRSRLELFESGSRKLKLGPTNRVPITSHTYVPTHFVSQPFFNGGNSSVSGSGRNGTTMIMKMTSLSDKSRALDRKFFGSVSGTGTGTPSFEADVTKQPQPQPARGNEVVGVTGGTRYTGDINVNVKVKDRRSGVPYHSPLIGGTLKEGTETLVVKPLFPRLYYHDPGDRVISGKKHFKGRRGGGGSGIGIGGARSGSKKMRSGRGYDEL